MRGHQSLRRYFYRTIIKTNDIRDSVHWIERYTTDEEVAEVFKIADTVIFPYKKTFHAQSGVLNLAIGYEKPCVVSDVGAMGKRLENITRNCGNAGRRS